MRDFLSERFVRLYAGPDDVAASVRDGQLWLSFRFDPKDTEWKTGKSFGTSTDDLVIVEGLAVPIDRPGWFLTAAHCVTEEPITLVYSTADNAESARAKVVWRDDVADLALLSADLGDVPLSRWSPEPETGELVFAAAQRSPSAGTMLNLDRASVDSFWVWHDAPVQDGDSGGAILDAEGRLVAIHSATGFDFWRMARARRAVRPDLDRLARLIGVYERSGR